MKEKSIDVILLTDELFKTLTKEICTMKNNDLKHPYNLTESGGYDGSNISYNSKFHVSGLLNHNLEHIKKYIKENF